MTGLDRYGERGPGAGAPDLEVTRPSDGSVVGRVPICSPEQVRAAVARGRVVQKDWGSLSSGDRARRMSSLLAVLASRIDDVSAVIQDETGKPEIEALSEIAVVTDLVRYYAKVGPRILRSRPVRTGWMLGKAGTVYREPYGVVGVISPWNYPLILSLEPAITAAFAGNSTVIKPSEFTPFTSMLGVELFAEAHLPEDLVQIVTGDGSTGAALIAGGVDKVAFTGSTATGRKVMQAAAAHLVPVQLELGGKDPAIVLDDADLERAAAGIAFGAFFNAGQTCISVERVYVTEGVYDAFVQRLVEVAGRLRAGTGPGVDVGPITTRSQLELVESQLSEALAAGARAMTGGQRSDPASNVLLPTVLVDVTTDMAVLRDETFGPVVSIVRVRDEDEAVERANEGRYGLFASVWTGDTARGKRVARRIRAGGVSVNDALTHYAVPGLPMGGVGESGFGRTRSEEGLLEMCRTRSVLVRNWGLRREPYWFPYRPRAEQLIRGLIAWRGGAGMGRLIAGLLNRGRR